MLFVFYISGHGLGHAARALEVVRSLLRRRPDTRIVVRSSASQWFFDASGVGPIDLQPVEVDTGIVQIDSLRIDEVETARRAAAFYATFEERVRAEAALLEKMGADLVVGDVPPLAFAAAHRAGVPSIAIANFTWDWIYAHYPQFEPIAPGVIAKIRDAYRLATHALRLPIHGGFEAMAAVTRDIPLIARHARQSKAATRTALGIDDRTVVVLASFGGHGLLLPYDAIARANPFTLVVTGFEMGSGGDHAAAASAAIGRASGRLIVAQQFWYPDLLVAADVVISKPGYGTVSECVANGTALIYTDRGRFAENDVMAEEMPRMLRCRFMPQDDLRAGRWSSSVDALLAQPLPPPKPATDGADVAADTILALD